jgi:signal transduction histidine kinase
MRLADFILANIEPILQEWEKFARSLAPGAKMEVLALRDDAEAILRASMRDMQTKQTDAQQVNKSKCHGGAGGGASDRLEDPSSVHGLERVAAGFSLVQVVSEYRALRASVLGLWRKSEPNPDIKDLADITRFNEAMDQSLAMAVASYTDRVDRSREMFLAILGHDLRNPLNSISMSAQLASMWAESDSEFRDAISQIESSVKTMSGLISDLMDFATTRLGTGMPLVISSVNLKVLSSEVLTEFKAANPSRTFQFETRGDLTCSCDGARVRQVISNFLGNALAHGSKEDDIEFSLTAEGQGIILTVRNQGSPIAPDLLPNIFDPMVRNTSSDAQQRRRPGSVGLGLYIAHDIVTAHGGTIDVTSTIESGTIFTVRLPLHREKH